MLASLWKISHAIESMKNIPILLADADPAARLATEEQLVRWGFAVTVCKTAKSVQRAMQAKEPPRLLLLSGRLKNPDTAKLLQQLRQKLGKKLFCIWMLNDANPDSVAEAINAGADDYILRPTQPHELRVRLNLACRILDLQHAAREQVGRDRLTGLWNHAMVHEMIARELKRAERDKLPVSFLLAEVDRLKAINDHHGPQVGDELLTGIAERLREALRSYDLCGRHSGGEFLVVLPRCGRANAMEIAERVRAAVAAQPVNTSVGELSTTVSCGIATTSRGQKTTEVAVIKALDDARFQAKRRGHNSVEAAVSIT